MSQASVGQHRGSTFSAGDPQDLGVTAIAMASKLTNTFLLGLMDCQQAVKDLGILEARVLSFDQLDEYPKRSLTAVLSRGPLTPQPVAESLTEAALRLCGDIFAVEVVVAIRVKEAVTKDGWRDSYRIAEQGLQSAGSPGAPARLNSVGHAQARVKLPGQSSECPAGRQECFGEELDGVRLQSQGGGGELGEGRKKPILCLDALCSGSGSPFHLSLNGFERVVVCALALLLLVGGIARSGESRRRGALVPKVDRLCDLRLNPRPTVALLHFEPRECYE